MIPRPLMPLALILLVPSTVAAGDAVQPIKGRVLDESGRPVAGADVSAVWGANGMDAEHAGTARPEDLWRNEGQMEPWGGVHVVTDAEGRFSIPPQNRKRTLWAYDRERRRGAVIRFDPRDPGKPVEARLRPLVKVFGAARFVDAASPLKWSCTYLNTPYDENDPLEFRRSAICGSYRSRFAFLVPPGTYTVSASSEEPHSATVEERTVTVTGDWEEIDLGALVLRPMAGVQVLIDRSKARGTWANYRENLGKRPPRWHVTDARGVAKDVQIDDFRGKWVVLYFWGPDCAPCLGKQLPELMRFYETHKAQRDRFEILAFCCDFSETIPDIRALERRLEPVKKAVWGGKDLPFPVLLDNTFQTYERFGLEGQGDLLLIDPQGRLIEGNLEALAKHLGRPGAASP